MRWKKSRRIPKWIAGETMSLEDVDNARKDEMVMIRGRLTLAHVWQAQDAEKIVEWIACGEIKRAVLNPEWLEQEEYLAERRADRLERAARVER